jgi:hypothetical protein
MTGKTDETDREVVGNPEFGVVARVTLPDGRIADVMPLAYGAARLGVGKAGEQVYDDVWDYANVFAALAAALQWDIAVPEPDGTAIRRPGEGALKATRRRSTYTRERVTTTGGASASSAHQGRRIGVGLRPRARLRR